jgi:hypothetical protein
LLTVTIWDTEAPTVTFPKLIFSGTIEICGCTPEPDSRIVNGEFVASLITEMLPATLPTAVGANATLNETLCPTAKFNGSEGPLTWKPAPTVFICATVTLLFPELVSTTAAESLLAPTATFPKFKFVVLLESCDVVATPMPLTLTVVGSPEALLDNATLPDTAAAFKGANTTKKLLDCPDPIVSGKLSPLKLKPGPLTSA